MSNIPFVTAAYSWYLKSIGFPQPMPADGQYWYWLSDYPFLLYKTMSGKLAKQNLSTGECSPFDANKSESIVYAPLISEARDFLIIQPQFKTVRQVNC